MIDRTKLKGIDAVYASHVPVLDHYLAGRRWPVLEFGAGWHSTPVLARHAEQLTTLEVSAEWAANVAMEVPTAEIIHITRDTADFVAFVTSRLTARHAVFSDGVPNRWRPLLVNLAMEAEAAIIFAHDWENQAGYDYGSVREVSGYERLVYRHVPTQCCTLVLRRLDVCDNVPRECPEHTLQEAVRL